MNEKRLIIGQRASVIGIILNFVLAGMKIAIGALSGMISIVADGVNNFSDAIASIISLIGFKLSSRPADDEHPFGHARFEYLAGIIVAFIVIYAGIELFKTSIDKIINPTDVEYSSVLFLVLIISIAIKLIMMIVYKKIGHSIGSLTLEATGDDSRNDCISTGVVLIAAVISDLYSVNLDGIMGLLVAVFILYSGLVLVNDTLKPFIGTSPDEEIVNDIEKTILSYEGVLGTHDLMVHDYGPGHFFASVHVEVPAEKDVLECHEIIDKIEEDFKYNKGIELVIHYDPIVTSDNRVSALKEYLVKKIENIDNRLTIHDLRIVPGDNNTNVIFDMVIPRDIKKSDGEICNIVKDNLAKDYPGHTAVIKVDHSFVSLGK